MMRAGRKDPVSTLATLAACLAASTLVGCYRPNVADKGFQCGPITGKRCPDGFQCDTDNICKRMLSDGGTDRGDATDARDAMDAADAPDMGQCFAPKPNCDPSDAGASCDPFCQSGCTGAGACRQKCSVNTLGALTCNDVVPMQLKTEFQACTIVNGATSAQTDVCAPGLVCLEDACGGPGFGRCYRFCRDDGDCPESLCLKGAAAPGGVGGGGAGVCDVPNVTCTPTPPTTGCAGGQGCFIATNRPTKTLCDCPGSARANEPCVGSRSCFAGLLCVDPNGGVDARCLQVCVLAKNGSDCPGVNQTCRMYTGDTGGAMVNATFGYCF